MSIFSINNLIRGSSVLTLAVLACNGSDVTRPQDVNDYDAIYHIITIDKPNEFNIDLLDFSVPDTLLETIDYVDPEVFWLDLSHDSLDLPITIEYPQSGDSAGTLPTATANLIKLFYGTLEIIGTDTTGGGNIPVRYSRDFAIRGEIDAQFARYGGDYNTRRGWLLTDLSDVVYSASYPQGISQIVLNSSSYSDYVLVPGIKALADIPEISPGESLSVTVYGSNSSDIYRLRYPSDSGFHTVTIGLDEHNNHTASFIVPGTSRYNHFLVEVFNIGSFQSQGVFRYEGVGAIFKTE